MVDFFYDNNGVIVLPGTNRSDISDLFVPTQPGRFDRIINIYKPKLNERSDIFNKPLKLSIKLNKNELINYLASISPGFVGSEIKNL